MNPYFTHDARDSLKSLQGVLLEKAIETVTETVETPNHQRRPTRGSDDAIAEDRQSASSASPDDLIVRTYLFSSIYFYHLMHAVLGNAFCLQVTNFFPCDLHINSCLLRLLPNNTAQNYFNLSSKGQESTQHALWNHFQWTLYPNQPKQHMLLLEGRWILPA